MPKRSNAFKRYAKHIPAIQSANVAHGVSQIFDILEHHGLTENHGEAMDIWGETNLLPSANCIFRDLESLQVTTLKQILKLTSPRLILSPSGSFLFRQLEQVDPMIISHIDFEYENEVSSEVLYYPQAPHFSINSCLTKSSVINQNLGLFTASFIDQKTKQTTNHSILSIISHFRQSHITGITLEQWIINYLYEQMYLPPTQRQFTKNELIFETVLPNTQSVILISFDQNSRPNILPISKFDVLDPELTYRQVINF